VRRNRVRIIGGELRSRLVAFPDRLGLRPTPDRVRGTLFNWLGQDLTGRTCLDLFAGSGVLGFEAASRGAALVVMVERDAQAAAALAENARALHCDRVQLVRADALEFLAKDTRAFDVVFLDPPYAWPGREGLLPRVAPRLRPGGLVYLEASSSLVLPAGWESLRQGKAGAVHYQLLRMTVSEQGSLSGDV
jgi:16S rRNA (guanine(966)-N(2))-methyltransferase RsmD